MSTNVSASDVKERLGSTNLSNSEIDSFISDADIYYGELTNDESVPSDVYDLVIECLAAHMIKAGPERQTESTDTGGVSYTGSFGEGLSATTFGQNAVQYDLTGKLADVGSESYLLTTSSDA